MELRKVEFNDWEILLEWRNEIETRKNSHNTVMVDGNEHKQWLKQSLENVNRHLYIAIENCEPVGTVRADFDEGTKVYELSWTIGPNFRGKGIGKKMVKALSAKSGDIDHLNPVESDHPLSGAN